MTKAEHRRFRKMGHRKLERMVSSQAGQIQSYSKKMIEQTGIIRIGLKSRIELQQYIDWLCRLSVWQWIKYKITGRLPNA